ncbi:MAG: hypothetical protein HW378_2475, partial [Anaerolineales bacterium]|nr:hypothetical protein [Anaerolineales bacterium]
MSYFGQSGLYIATSGEVGLCVEDLTQQGSDTRPGQPRQPPRGVAADERAGVGEQSFQRGDDGLASAVSGGDAGVAHQSVSADALNGRASEQ